MIPRALPAIVATLLLPVLGFASRGAAAKPEPGSLQQTAPRAQSGDSRELSFDVRRVGRDVYALIRRNPPGYLFECNAGFIIGPRGVAVIDAQFTTREAADVIAALRRITSKPVLWVINTHSHDDHISGNQAWREAYPKARFVAHEETALDMASGYLARRKQLAEAIPPGVEAMRQALAAGRGSDGQPLEALQRAKLRNDVALGERYAMEAPAFRLIAPDTTFRDSLELDLGGRRPTLRFLGRAHTAGDVVVELPDERLVFTGDLVVWPVPLAGTTSYPLEYAATLERLLAIPHRALVPGHGPVMNDDAYALRMAALMRSLRDQAVAAVARGDSLAQARSTIDLEPFRRSICGGSKVLNMLFDAYVTQPGVARAFEQASAAR